MNPYEVIEKRFGFALPEFYRTVQGRGYLDYSQGSFLAFYDCEWLNLDAIAKYKFNSWEIAADGGFVPFAITGRHEPYCWRLDWATGSEPPIVLCERSEKAVCLAPDFRGFLYRMALEALAGCNDIRNTPRCKDDLDKTLDLLESVLPERWVERLRELQRRPWQEDVERGNLYVLAQKECDEIIKADLSFAHLNENFFHDKGYIERLKKRST